MGIDEDREAIADLKARMKSLEEKVSDIQSDQKISMAKAQEAALREKDLGAKIELLSKDIEEHMKIHGAQKENRIRAVDVIIAIGVLLSSALSAYGAVAMVAISKAVGK